MSFSVTGAGAKAKVTAPKSVKAGVAEIAFTNDSKEPRSGELIRVDGDQTIADYSKVVQNSNAKGIPGWLHGAGGAGTTAPGATTTVTQVLKPGRYFFLAELDEDEGGEPPPGMEVEVTGDGGGELPSTDATVTASEYSFESSGLKAGKNKITFDNQGKELHHWIAAPIAKGRRSRT